MFLSLQALSAYTKLFYDNGVTESVIMLAQVAAVLR